MLRIKPSSLLLVNTVSQSGGGRQRLQMPTSGLDLPQDRLASSSASWSGKKQTGVSISLASNNNYTWVLVVLQQIPLYVTLFILVTLQENEVQMNLNILKVIWTNFYKKKRKRLLKISEISPCLCLYTTLLIYELLNKNIIIWNIRPGGQRKVHE